ncbi:MAG: hypothetical protein HY553_02365 [Elusimicrobia bacterium]|nr:hypothetical protein [Elusimicrobiota bacterium]
MPVRRQTLQEWFLDYQLRHEWKRRFFNPVSLDVDVTALAEAYEAKGRPAPWSAIIVKAAALLAERVPAVNRVVFRTFYGTRVVDFDQIIVNFPMLRSREGQPVLSAITIPEPHRLSIEMIRDVIRAGRRRKLSDTKVTKYVVGPNTFLNRLRLKLLHATVVNFPHLYVKLGGGGLSVTSLLFLSDESVRCRVTPYGMTAMTIGALTVSREAGGRRLLHLGLGFDHTALRGDEGAVAAQTLARILQSRDPEMLAQFV